MTTDPWPAIEYHRLTAHSPSRGAEPDPRRVQGYAPMRPERRPPPFKWYPDPPVPLPEPVIPEVDGAAALSGRGARATGPLDVERLAGILFFSAGVVRQMETPAFGTVYFRAAGSAGNLHPLEVYVVARDITGLPDGVYHYDALGHGLTAIGPASSGPASSGPASGGREDAGGPAALVVTGVPWRTAWKYTERGFRHLYWDAGTMLAHTLTLCEVVGVDAHVLMGFVDRQVTELVGADGDDEFPLAVIALGAGDPALEPTERARPGRLATDPVRFPLITGTQRSGDLADREAVASWRMEGIPLWSAPLAGGPAAGVSLTEVIRRRGSTREFATDRPAPAEALHWGLQVAARPVPGDFLEPGTTLLSHRLVVHAVDGVEPGAYVWTGDGLELVRAGPLRPESRHLCLDQPLGGDSAFTVFHCSDLDLLRFLGGRGYRAMQLEAGIAEGRLHLAAYAMGLGATGLTFYDNEVSRFFATKAVPMLVTAVGTPAYRSRPGGLPRHPVTLRR